MFLIGRRIEELAQIDRLGFQIGQFDADDGAAGHDRGMPKRTRRPGMLSGSSASFAAIGGTRPSLGSRLVGNGVTRGSLRVSAMGLRLTTVWNEAAFGPASSTRRAARQSFHIR